MRVNKKICKGCHSDSCNSKKYGSMFVPAKCPYTLEHALNQPRDWILWLNGSILALNLIGLLINLYKGHYFLSFFNVPVICIIILSLLYRKKALENAEKVILEAQTKYFINGSPTGPTGTGTLHGTGPSGPTNIVTKI
jgi:hypothetical protein